jgi:hypothetical protein
MRFADLLISFKEAQKQISNSMEQSTREALSRLARSEIPLPFMEALIFLTYAKCFVTGPSAEIMFSRCILSNTTRQMLIGTHYIGDMFWLKL